MPRFHTKTIESILSPVAQQVSRLVILHEEAEDGSAMPDLEKPVKEVSRAVANLIKVGKETINASDDAILKQDMPVSLNRVETASRLLEEASMLLKSDPYSQVAREKLIEGSRGILQGTSSLLLCFDESEVRKIVRECKKVLDYLAIAEVIESMEDLLQFVQDISPCLKKVSSEVDARHKELTHQVHRDILARCLDQIKILTPILVCSMKIFVQIHLSGGKGIDEASENRNYLSERMTDEINEIIRVLQLTTYDEEEFDADNLTAVKRAQNAVKSRLQAANDWLEDSLAVRGGLGEKSVRQILDYARNIADRCLSPESEMIRKLAGDIFSMTDALCEFRQDGKGSTVQAESLARSIKQKLQELDNLMTRAVRNVERSGVHEPAHTVSGRLEQARRWFENPQMDDNNLGQKAVSSIVQEARKIVDTLAGPQKAKILSLCNETDSLSHQLSDLCHHGQGGSQKARTLARTLDAKLHELKDEIQNAIIGRILDDMLDVMGPLKQFNEAVRAPEGIPGREQNFNEKANQLQNFTKNLGRTSRMAAAGGSGYVNKKTAEQLLNAASHIENLSPQLISAGRILFANPGNKSANEHYDNLQRQYGEGLQNIRRLVDEATDSSKFLKQSMDKMLAHTKACEDAIHNGHPQQLVDHASQIARLGNRVLMVAKQETDNSEDPYFISRIEAAMNKLQNGIPEMVQNARNLALNISDPMLQSRWRDCNQTLLDAVNDVGNAIGLPNEEILNQNFRPLQMNESKASPESRIIYESRNYGDGMPPSRPPLPSYDLPPPRPPLPETDDEDETFVNAPLPNQPIMIAAHGLHREVRQWSSKDNEIIAAAKRMASLMAKLSQLVRGEGGTKRDLIACAKAIAEASNDVARLAKELARECTDKRMRTNLLQVCERIPTIGTQLNILSTVKATMLGAQENIPYLPDGEVCGGTEEDQEATDMLVCNAQNLMQSVKETVRAAEAASIKIRTDAGIRLRWVRKQPWYQY